MGGPKIRNHCRHHVSLAPYLNVSDVLSEFCGDDVQFRDVDGVARIGHVVHLEVGHVHPRYLVLEEPERGKITLITIIRIMIIYSMRLSPLQSHNFEKSYAEIREKVQYTH